LVQYKIDPSIAKPIIGIMTSATIIVNMTSVTPRSLRRDMADALLLSNIRFIETAFLGSERRKNSSHPKRQMLCWRGAVYTPQQLFGIYERLLSVLSSNGG
jgi:hypothetical protein